jgi:pilus assembly protein CpaE
MINWYYFSDASSPFRKFEAVLEKSQHSLIYIDKIKDMQQHFLKHQQSVLFLKADSKYDVYELCQEVSVLYPYIYIVLIVQDDLENMKKAMQVGASDLFRTSSSDEEIKETIVQAENYLKQRESKDKLFDMGIPKVNNRVISVCSPKGGLGRTAFIVNAAVAFAKEGKKVAVIDANLQFGEVALYFDLKPKRTIYEWVKEAYGNPHYSIDQYLLSHQSGVSVLAAPPRPEFFEFIHAEHMNKVIEDLKELFDVIIIDTPAYLSEIHLICLKKSDDILIMMTNEIPVLRTTKMYIDILESLDFKGKAKLLFNRELKNKGLDRERIEEILEMKIFSTVPEQETTVKASINEGVPFLLSQPRAPISKAVIGTIELLDNKYEAGIKPRKKERLGLFSKR